MLPKNTILTFKLDRHSYRVDIRLLLVGKNEKNCMEAILYCERCRKAYLGGREKNFHMKWFDASIYGLTDRFLGEALQRISNGQIHKFVL